jgi:type VI secretion system protein ImpL
MNLPQELFSKWLAGIVGVLSALILSAFAFPKLRSYLIQLGRYLVIPAIFGLLVLAVVLQVQKSPWGWGTTKRIPQELIGGYWIWLALLLIGTIASTILFVRLSRKSAGGSRTATEERFPDVETAWGEIAIRLEHAGIVPEDQTYYLVLAPDEDEVRALIETAGIQVFATVPDGPSPLRAFATSDGVLLSCVGSSGFGQGDPSASARLGSVCRSLRELRPDAPPVRGVTITVPMSWIDRPEATANASAARDDLRAVRRSLGLRCPVFLLFTAMEQLPGFTEFIARMAATGSPQVLGQRVGFSVPSSEAFSGDLARQAMIWMSGWFHEWILNLLAADPLNAAGNEQLITLDYEFLRRRKGFCAVMESVLATHRGGEPVLFRGCYFVATGQGRDERAFAAGLLRGARGRILADHVATTWSEQARHDDRRHVRAAVAVGAVVGTICLLLWAGIIQRVEWWGVAGLLAMAVTWAVVLFRMPRR